MSDQTTLWVVFNVVVVGLLWLDLKVLHRHAHVVSLKEAATWSVIWVCIALLFSVGIHFKLGHQKALEFLTGYVIEKSLSVDNMFVFILIFAHFKIPPRYQSRVLHWGILGALAMRFVLILAGVELIKTFHWMIYVFGALLVFTGAKMAYAKEDDIDPGENFLLGLFRKFIPFQSKHEGEDFFVFHDGRWKATPLFATLLVVESSDLIFAVDSIPAVLAVSTDTFIVYTSNVFAILGLRALYFLLAGIMGIFRYLKLGISVILVYVGVKMLITDIYKIPISVSLMVIAGVLIAAISASMVAERLSPKDEIKGP